LLVNKWHKQETEPLRLRDDIIVQEGDKISVALAKSTVASPAQSTHGFDDVSSSESSSNLKSLIVAGGVVDDKNLVGCRVESVNCIEASFQKSGTIAGADDNGDRMNLFLAVERCGVLS
jgi:hypothetical protein